MAIGGLTWITLPPTSFSLYSSATDCFFSLLWTEIQLCCWHICIHFVFISVVYRVSPAITKWRLPVLLTWQIGNSESAAHRRRRNLAQICRSACFRVRILARKKQQLVGAAITIHRAKEHRYHCNNVARKSRHGWQISGLYELFYPNIRHPIYLCLIPTKMQ